MGLEAADEEVIEIAVVVERVLEFFEVDAIALGKGADLTAGPGRLLPATDEA